VVEAGDGCVPITGGLGDLEEKEKKGLGDLEEKKAGVK
jgi:hypothetical protein